MFVYCTSTASMFTLDGGYKITSPWGIVPMGGSAPGIVSDLFLGLLMPWGRHPRSPRMLASEVKALEVVILIWLSEEGSLVIGEQLRKYHDVILSYIQVFLHRRPTESGLTILKRSQNSTLWTSETWSSLFTTSRMRASSRFEHLRMYLLNDWWGLNNDSF